MATLNGTSDPEQQSDLERNEMGERPHFTFYGSLFRKSASTARQTMQDVVRLYPNLSRGSASDSENR